MRANQFIVLNKIVSDKKQDNTVLVNPMFISAIESHPDGTVVHLMGGMMWTVLESIDAIKKLIDKTSNILIQTRDI